MSDIEEEGLARCPVCGREQPDWTENDGDGVEVSGIVYCSVDCAQRDQAR
ncbi:MAG: hypothetical protein J2P58_14420 [Acidimicrobiaceae bacterium]|nr:hypothetical protein [Acidimicrobiaceae bacterium]